VTLDPRVPPPDAARRLLDAYNHYVACFDDGLRPGSPEAFRLAQARIDLTLCLAADGGELPELVVTQVMRDAAVLLSTTQALPEA